MFKDNNFSRDTHEQHYQRVFLCAEATQTYQVELGLRQSWVDDMQTHYNSFSGMLDAQNIEDAEWHGATADLDAKRDALYELNSNARWMVKTILDDPGLADGNKRMIDDSFDIDVELTKGKDALATSTKALLVGQEKLVEIGAEWKLPDGMVTNLQNGLTDMENAFKAAGKEHSEKLGAMENVYVARENGERLLRNIYRWAISVWNDDDNRLLEFGFVPKSQIWTPGEPEPGEPGENEYPNAPSNFVGMLITEGVYMLTWNALDNVQKYNVYRTVINPGDPEPMDPPAEPYATEIEAISFTDTDYKSNKVQWYWVGGVVDGVVGELAKTK